MTAGYDNIVKDKATKMALQSSVSKFGKSAMKVLHDMMGKKIRVLSSYIIVDCGP